MSDLTELVSSYLAIWNEPDADARERAIATVFAEDGTYTDPMAAVQGRAGLAAVISGVREQFPGHDLKIIGSVDGHHNVARFTWELVPAAGGESLVIGFDVAVTGDSGLIQDIYGFLDKVPAM